MYYVCLTTRVALSVPLSMAIRSKPLVIEGGDLDHSGDKLFSRARDSKATQSKYNSSALLLAMCSLSPPLTAFKYSTHKFARCLHLNGLRDLQVNSNRIHKCISNRTLTIAME